MPLTIQELVRAADLGLMLVAGRENAARPVLSVQTCDVDDPLAWTSAGTLLLRTEWGTESISERDAKRVAELSEGGIAGLGIGVYALGTSPCDRLVQVADEVGLPLLTVPPRTSFQQVSAYVVAHNASGETYRLRRTLSLHDALLTRFENDGIDGVMEAACSLLRGRILLLGDGGEVQGTWPGAPQDAAPLQEAKELWDAYVAVAPSDGEGAVETSMGSAYFSEIRCGEEWSGVLFCLGACGGTLADVDVRTVAYLKGLVQLYQAGAFVTLRRQRESREALLRRLATGELPAHRISAALARHSISHRDPLVVVLLHPSVTRARSTCGVLDLAQRRRDLATAVLASATEYLEHGMVPFLSGWWEGVAALVLPVVPSTNEPPGLDVSAVVQGLQEHLESSIASLEVSAGISDPRSAVRDMPTAFSHALQALQRAMMSAAGSGQVVLYSELGVEQEVLDALPSRLLEMLRFRVIGRLSEGDPDSADRLLEVLSSYMEHNGSVAATANALFMHRNTLHRRIARIEELLGVDFGVFRDVVEVRLGLRADEVLRSRGGTSELQCPPTDVLE